MNRLGFCEEEGEFARFTGGGAAAAAPSGNGAGNSADDDDDEENDFSSLNDDDDDDDDDDPSPQEGDKGTKRRQTVQLNPDDLIRQVSEVTARSLRQAQQEGQPALTEAEIQQRLGRPTVSAELIAKLRNPEITPEEMATALQELQDGTYRYAMTTTQHLLQHQLAPLLEMRSQFAEQQRAQKEAAFRGNLVKAYPTLRKYEAAVSQAMAELTSEGFTAKGLLPEQIYKAVAQRAKKVIRRIMPEFSLKQPQGAGNHRQAGSFKQQRTGQVTPAGQQLSGAASFSHII